MSTPTGSQMPPTPGGEPGLDKEDPLAEPEKTKSVWRTGRVKTGRGVKQWWPERYQRHDHNFIDAPATRFGVALQVRVYRYE
eukprot:COSAG05_NODE_239_length_13139_cov_14.870475_15_plen_82_part_00